MKKLIVILTLCFTAFAFAADKTASNADAVIAKLTHGQLTVSKTFSAPMGLKGYVLATPSGQKTIAFMDAKAQYLFIGNLVKANGTNLTNTYMEKYVRTPQAKKAYSDIRTTHFITDGSSKAPHTIYVLIDPNCAYCHLLYKELRPMIDNNQVQVRWIPVAIRPNSAGKTAHMLSVTNSKAISLLKENEAKFDMKTEQGGLSALVKNNSAANKKAFAITASNTKFFVDHQFMGTPVILYQDKQGTANAFPGYAPKDALSKLIDTASK